MRRRRVKIYVLPGGKNIVDKWSALLLGEQILEVVHEMSYETSDYDCSCPGYMISKACKHVELKAGNLVGVDVFNGTAFTYARIVHQIFMLNGLRTTQILDLRNLGMGQSLAMIVAHPSYPDGAHVYFDKDGEPRVRLTLTV